MRLSPFVAAALLAMALFPVTNALAFTLEQGSASANGSSQLVDPDRQVDIFGLQNQESESDPTVKLPNANPAFNAPQGGVAFPTYNPFTPLAPPRK
jgi:hypothetical protein